MLNSALCPLCKDSIGHQMDERHAAIVEELLEATNAASIALANLGVSDDGKHFYSDVLLNLRRIIAKSGGTHADHLIATIAISLEHMLLFRQLDRIEDKIDKLLVENENTNDPQSRT